MDLTRRGLAALAGLGAVGVHAAAPRMRALLVGVSTYPGLPPELHLKGPRNDIERLQGLLQRRGFAAEDVTVLADGVSSSRALPTRAAIVDALQRLQRDSQPGDFALLYFCGHGSQQPVPPQARDAADEPDGLYEVFLPQDVSRLVPGPGPVRVIENGLVDFELRAQVDRLAARGVFVWAVFDACHSASLVRGGSDPEVRYRQVPPQALGYTDRDLAAARSGSARVPRAGSSATAAQAPAGQAVYFYASQTTQKAIEMALPPGGWLGLGRRQHGAFSYALIQALEASVPMTYRQLAQQILVTMASLNLQPDLTVSDQQKPAFGGTALDAPVFMQATGLPAPQWAVLRSDGADLTVQAGALHRLAPGAVLAIVDSPIARAEAVWAYAQVTAVDLAESRAQWLAYNGKPVPAAGALKPGAYARLQKPGADYALRVLVEYDASTSGREGEAVRRAVERLRADGTPGVAAVWTERAADADIVLRVERTRALVLPRSLAQVRALQPRDALAELPYADGPAQATDAGRVALEIAQGLHRIARATNLFRMAAQLSGQPSARSLGLRPQLMLHRGGRNAGEALTEEMTPVLQDGDQIRISIRNAGPVPLDVNLIYVDARFGMKVWPGRGPVTTLEAGALWHLPVPLYIGRGPVDQRSYGIERVLIVGMRQHPLKEDNNLHFLAQDSLQAVRSAPEDSRSDDVQAFRDAAFALHATRAGGGGGPPAPPGPGTVIAAYTFHVVPAGARS